MRGLYEVSFFLDGRSTPPNPGIGFPLPKRAEYYGYAKKGFGHGVKLDFVG